jgi:HK97 family phage prohead protease
MQFKQDNLTHISSHITVTKAKELPNGEFEAVLSTDDLDRHGERVSIKGLAIPKGRTIKMYYNHKTTGESIPIGTWPRIWKSKDGKLMGRGKIDLLDDFEIKIDKKIKLGTLDSISIGFYPQEFDGESSTWTKSELVEASVVAEPANTSAVVTAKELQITDEEVKKAIKVRLKGAESEAELITVKRLVKGEVEDVLTSPKKWELMKPYYDVIFAFEEAYYDKDTEPTEFNKLLTETIGLLQKIVDGTYDLTKANDESGVGDPDMETAIGELKSRIGAVEEAVKSSADNPAIKTLIRVRVAGKKVDQAAEELNRIVKVKLKETI